MVEGAKGEEAGAANASLILNVFEGRLQAGSGLLSKVFPWPRATPLAIFIENTHPVNVVVDVHGGMSEDTSRLLDTPIRSVTVGAKSRTMVTLHPDTDWVPNAWVNLTSATAPLSGNIKVIFARPGV